MDAAASLREGLEETLTVLKLGLPPRLRRFFATTNCIENLIGTVRHVTRNVKRWRDGAMIRRWVGLALGRAATRFRRIKGHGELATLATALRKTAPPRPRREPRCHFEPRRRDGEGQGRLRSDLEEGGRYVGIPPVGRCGTSVSTCRRRASYMRDRRAQPSSTAGGTTPPRMSPAQEPQPQQTSAHARARSHAQRPRRAAGRSDEDARGGSDRVVVIRVARAGPSRPVRPWSRVPR